MKILAATLRERAQGIRMLVVHEPGDELATLCHVLRYTFVVSEATTPTAAVERASELPFACIVCVANGEYRIQEFLDEVAHAAPLDAEHVVFVVPRVLASDVVIYSRSDGSSWARAPELPHKLASITRVIEALRQRPVLPMSMLPAA